jgi:hypothetical protein
MGARVVLHVAARFQGGEPLLADDSAKALYLRLASAAWAAFRVTVHYFIGMTTHSHWLVEGSGGAIAKAIHRSHGDFARKSNQRLDRRGHVFQSRYRARYVTDERYLRRLTYYLANNATDARIVERPSEYRWSADPAYRGGVAVIPVETTMILAVLGGPEGYARLVDQPGRASDIRTAVRNDLLGGLVRAGLADLEQSRVSDPFVRQLRARIATKYLAQGAHIATVAKALGVSTRTLRRMIAGR